MIASGIIDTILASWWFIIVLVLLLLTILWMQHIKSMRREKARGRRRPGINPVIILGMVTIFALLLLALPWYLGTLEAPPADRHRIITPVVAPEDRAEIILEVEGMTHTGCEDQIQRRVAGLPGIELAEADHETGQTRVVYDRSLTSAEEIASVIEEAGYGVVELPEQP